MFVFLAVSQKQKSFCLFLYLSKYAMQRFLDRIVVTQNIYFHISQSENLVYELSNLCHLLTEQELRESFSKQFNDSQMITLLVHV